MDEVKIYTLLQKVYNDEDAKAFIQASKQNNYCTKEDLKDLEIRMMKEFVKVHEQISGLLPKLLAGTAAMIAVATYLIKI